MTNQLHSHVSNCLVNNDSRLLYAAVRQIRLPAARHTCRWITHWDVALRHSSRLLKRTSRIMYATNCTRHAFGLLLDSQTIRISSLARRLNTVNLKNARVASLTTASRSHYRTAGLISYVILLKHSNELDY